MQTQIALRVFTDHPKGGNPCLVTLNADNFSEAQMKEIAANFGHECAFLFKADPEENCDFSLRFFLPLEETEMCGHATLATLWALKDQGRISAGNYRIGTKSGVVDARIGTDGSLAFSQPNVFSETLDPEKKSRILSSLKITENELANGEIINACTSRMKTLVPLQSTMILNSLSPDFDQVKEICMEIGSTGLYPYCRSEQDTMFHARQFPRSAGYPEDAATGIAASALAGVLKQTGVINSHRRITVLQGEAMGNPSRLDVDFEESTEGGTGYWILGQCIKIGET